jgi:hypothetical protein
VQVASPVICSALWLTVALAQPPATRGTPIPEISSEEYDQVLDRIFPRRLDAGKVPVVFELSLRSAPSFEAESQIDIMLRRNQAPIVRYSYADRNVYSSCNDLLARTGAHQPDVLARSIPISEKAISMTAHDLLRLQQALLQSLPASLSRLAPAARPFYDLGTQAVTLDGESFELWYAQGTTELKLRFSDVDRGRPNYPKAPTLTKWAHALNRKVQLSLPAPR